MRVLELYFGNGSFSREALKHGAEITGVDIEDCPEDLKGKIDFHKMDVLQFDYTKYPSDRFDFVWASTPCTTYSMARHDKDRTKPTRYNCKAISDEAKLHDVLAKRSIEIIEYFGKGAVENPRACLRKQRFIRHFVRVPVTYCQYGFTNMKPTDLFFYPSVPNGFVPRACNINDRCHTPGPRGSSPAGSFQAKPKSTRSLIPPRLCEEIFLAICKPSSFLQEYLPEGS